MITLTDMTEALRRKVSRRGVEAARKKELERVAMAGAEFEKTMETQGWTEYLLRVEEEMERDKQRLLALPWWQFLLGGGVELRGQIRGMQRLLAIAPRIVVEGRNAKAALDKEPVQGGAMGRFFGFS